MEAEEKELKEALESKSGDELRMAQQRLIEIEKQLMMTIENQARDYVTHHPLNSFQLLLKFMKEIECPENFSHSLWHEEVSFDYLQNFPRNAKYVTIGCKDKDGMKAGRFIAFYPNRKVIVDAIVDGMTTVYYPNGQKALRGILIGDIVYETDIWSFEGLSSE